MQTIFDLKEQAVTDTPLLLFDCVLPDGRTEHWSTHTVTVNAMPYAARVLQHNVFELQASSDQGVDGVPRISLVLANAAGGVDAPEVVRDILGAPQKVSRQVIYRRCLEQWIYHHPLPLCVTWSIPHNARPTVYSVRPLSIEKP